MVVLMTNQLSKRISSTSSLAILFLHGAASSKETFIPLINVLAKNDKSPIGLCIAVDMPAHGKSDEEESITKEQR